jgi:3D (Asp-Asp-Asp) domain-containing protein
MFLSRSFLWKIVATLGAAVGFVFVYETTIPDSRHTIVAETPANPQPGSRLHYTATAYCKGETTASGVAVRTGIAAADPTLLPVGTVVRLDMPDSRFDGIWTIMDTGPAVQGRIVDLYMWSCHDALRFGRRPIELTVLRLGWNPQNSEPGRAETLYRQREVERARLPILAKPIDPVDAAEPAAPVTPPVVPALAPPPPS